MRFWLAYSYPSGGRFLLTCRGRERRAAARKVRRARGQHIGRPKALDKSKAGLARRMHSNGESASTIADTLGVSRATVYRMLAEQSDGAD